MSRSKYDEKAGQMLFFYVSEERGVDPFPPPLFLSFHAASTFIRETERQRNRESERGDSKNGDLTLLMCNLCFSDSIEKRKRRRQKLNGSRPTKESRREVVPTLYLSCIAHPRSSAHTNGWLVQRKKKQKPQFAKKHRNFATTTRNLENDSVKAVVKRVGALVN